MEKFCVKSLCAKCNIVTEKNIKNFLINNKCMFNFPIDKIYDYNNSNVPYYLYYFDVPYENRKIVYEANNIIVKYPSNMLTESNIIYIARYLIEKQYAENNFITCHSACIEKNNNAILLLGDAGSGKTSIALNMCLNYGFSLISNDQTIIGLKKKDLIACGGTKFINLRYSSVNENIKTLKYLFKDTVSNVWNDKITVRAMNLGIEEQYKPTIINTILILHIDNRLDKLCVENGDTWGNNFKLYSNLTENIRNSNSTIVDKLGHPIGYIPSFDTEKLYNNRVKMINLINNSKYLSISGNINDVILFINNMQEYNMKGKCKVLKIE